MDSSSLAPRYTQLRIIFSLRKLECLSNWAIQKNLLFAEDVVIIIQQKK